ncbi:protein rolling stone-like [Diadema antillarum]|uniref:protein rolling stone-like n=1 Tax=Diadema antillarum TaxID=105358 RepID=UPI003A8849A2
MTSEGSQVFQDSPPTAPTTMDSEDESRKWYSVQWVDFKLCCRRLRDVSTQHPRIPFWLYALYRFAIAAYFLSIFLYYFVSAAKIAGPWFLVYYNVWTFLIATCYVCFAFVNTALDFVKSRMNAALQDKFRYQIQWFLFNIIATPCLIVSVFNWWLWLNYAPKEEAPNLFTVSTVELPTAICLIEILVTLIVVRFVHVVYPLSCLIIYLFFAVVYWVAGGTDRFENHYIYFFLDFENYPDIAAATVVAVIFGTLLFQAILKGLYAIRVRSAADVSCEDAQRICREDTVDV